MRILIVKRDKIGDMLLTTPLIEHLRGALPGARVSLLASDYCSWVMRGHPSVERLWSYPRLRAGSILRPGELLRYWRAHREARAVGFDVAIAAGGDFSRRALAKTLSVRAARTIAYVPDGQRVDGLTDPLPWPSSGHEVDRMLGLAAPLGIPFPALAPAPSYRLPEASRAFAERWLAERKVAPGRYVVLGIGSRRPRRQPSTAQVLQWSAHWRQQHGMQTVFMWTPGAQADPRYPGDDEIARPVLEAKRAEIHPFRGPLDEALGLVWQAKASVFPDSGLMHFAAASPGGVLGLFAGDPGWPAQWAPRGPRASWLNAPETVAGMDDAELLRLAGKLLA
jgi:ADP-heptose:LPS heptosyltransferase